jgi:ABC-type branched-subunit amino acid transport system substrate-binding protein
MNLKLIVCAALAATCYLLESASAQIKIGVAEALTGNAAQYGVPIRKGLELRGRGD